MLRAFPEATRAAAPSEQPYTDHSSVGVVRHLQPTSNGLQPASVLATSSNALAISSVLATSSDALVTTSDGLQHADSEALLVLAEHTLSSAACGVAAAWYCG